MWYWSSFAFDLTLAAKRTENVGILFGFYPEKRNESWIFVRRNVEKRSDIVMIIGGYRNVSRLNLQEIAGKRWEKRKLFHPNITTILGGFYWEISDWIHCDITTILGGEFSRKIIKEIFPPTVFLVISLWFLVDFLRLFSLWYRCTSRCSSFRFVPMVILGLELRTSSSPMFAKDFAGVARSLHWG